MDYHVPHWIAGNKIKASTRELPIYHPSAGVQQGTLQVANLALVNQAVAAAKEAFSLWQNLPITNRAQLLFKLKSLLDTNTSTLAELISNEHGKTREEAIGEVKRGIEVLDYACGIPTLITGAFAANIANGIDAHVVKQPLGVCVGITPFNFPAMIPLWMFSMAIACGNTFVLKPSEKDPSVSILLAELVQQAGIADGVLNVIQGDSETVDLLLAHPDVKAVSFVGSSAAAASVSQKANAAHKRVQAFGGAKNHAVIMPDANIEKAADALVNAAYGSAGERCMAISVAVAVGDQVADQLIKSMLPKIKQWRMGKSDAANIDMGPLVTQAHLERVTSYLTLGKEEGATLVVDGRHTKHTEKGFFLAPSLFDHVQSHMRIYREEIFGPVLCMVRVKNLSDAIHLINHHDYANGCAIFTNDGYAAKKFADEIEVGMVGINVAVPIPAAHLGFSGWKQSCFADIGMYGTEAIHFYTRQKKLITRWFEKEIT